MLQYNHTQRIFLKTNIQKKESLIINREQDRSKIEMMFGFIWKINQMDHEKLVGKKGEMKQDFGFGFWIF